MVKRPREYVAANIRAEAARRRLSQVALAERLGVSVERLSRRLTGRVAIDVDELADVADALGLQPADLLAPHPVAEAQLPGLEDDPSPP